MKPVRNVVSAQDTVTVDQQTSVADAARIMAAHGGRLVLESAAEWGTSFAVSVPTVGKEKP